MGQQAFDNLATEKFRVRMRRHAVEIYKQLFPGCVLEELSKEGSRVHVLDQHFGIDALVTLVTGQWISIQEKFRAHRFLVDRKLRMTPVCPDFTQEFMNAAGTTHEEPGEWFKLAAQLYFYGWASKDESRFEKWFLMDVVRYKLLIEEYGGLGAIGTLKRNNAHGMASFYAIPINTLRPVWVATSGTKGLLPIAKVYKTSVKATAPEDTSGFGPKDILPRYDYNTSPPTLITMTGKDD